MTLSCRFVDGADPQWPETPSLTIVASGRDATLRVVVLRDDALALSIEIQDEHGGMPWRDARIVGELLMIGGLHHAHAIALSDPPRLSASVRMSGYFCCFHVPEELDGSADAFDVLAVGCSEVVRFGPSGDVVWVVSNLAVDGIVLHRVVNGRIRGEAEWDPPGGWEPFELDVDTGEVLVAPASRMRW